MISSILHRQNTTGAGRFHQKAAIRLRGTQMHHMKMMLVFMSNLASPPALKMPSSTTWFTDWAAMFNPVKAIMILR